MTWRWLDLVTGTDDRTGDAVGSIPVRTVAGAPAGALVWWSKSPERPGRALRVDARLLAGGGGATWISWCRFEGDESLAFDDCEVTGALRRCLANPWPDAVSSMLVDWSRIAGSITTGAAQDVTDDPFTRLFPQRLLMVEAGLLGSIPAPTGPGVTRYGSGNPWPWDTYAGQAP